MKNLIFAFMGLYLILDGFLSIIVNLEQGWFAQLVRVIRLLIGVTLIIIAVKEDKR